MDATLFATYTKSLATSNYDAVVMASDGQTANFHVGEKYPIRKRFTPAFSKARKPYTIRFPNSP